MVIRLQRTVKVRLVGEQSSNRAVVPPHPSPLPMGEAGASLAFTISYFGELRSAKQRLEKMLADGVFAFTRKVDARSFKILCAILAEGDVSKASRALGMPDPSVRTLMRRWRGREKEHLAMLELVRWRKKVGRKETVPLNEAVMQGKAETTDYPGLLSDVLDGLLSMTDGNWQERCEELAELVRTAM